MRFEALHGEATSSFVADVSPELEPEAAFEGEAAGSFELPLAQPANTSAILNKTAAMTIIGFFFFMMTHPLSFCIYNNSFR